MKGRGIDLHVHLTNSWLYTLMALLFVAIVSVGVYAVVSDPTKGWHDWGQIDNIPADFSDGEINWSEVTDIPGDISDGDDGYKSLADLQVAVNNDFHNLGGVDAIHHDNPTHIPKGISCTTTQDCAIDAGPCYVTSVSCSLTY
ncbi:MAG: hypothetical protein IIA85_02490 [Nanoarchaeota archaeon]|nr:hypothetical protein [Nanoarchaeota archaeon]